MDKMLFLWKFVVLFWLSTTQPWILDVFNKAVVVSSHTANCYKNSTTCGDAMCCCNSVKDGGRMTCVNAVHRLTYIPKPPPGFRVIEQFLFTGNYLPTVSQRTLSNLTNVRIIRLSLNNNSIKNIGSKSLHNLRDLKHIDLSENNHINIEQLQKALTNRIHLQSIRLAGIGLDVVSLEAFFRHLDKEDVQSLDLSGNDLNHQFGLNISFFTKWPRLHELKLIKCNITNIVITSELFVSSLQLNNNQFGPSPPRLCNGSRTMLPAITELRLAYNKIQNISDKDIACMTALETLDLSGNAVHELEGNTFASLRNLKRMNFNSMRNGMIIRPFAFNNSNLKRLTLNLNMQFKFNVSHIFDGLKNLDVLKIANSFFDDMSDESFVEMLSPLKKLKNLNLVNTGLNHIPGIFRVLRQLSSLNIGHNRIHALNNSFQHAVNIRQLSLTGNDISLISKKDLPVHLIKTLKSIDLSLNPFSCTCSLLWFRSWIDKTIRTKRIEILGWPHHYQCKSLEKTRPLNLADYHPTIESCAYHDPLIPLYISAGCIFMLLVIIPSLFYKNRWHLQYLYYKLKKGGKLEAERLALLQNNDDVTYDAYVIYDDEDRAFVHNDFRKLMEQTHGLKLHIWHRDAENGVKLEVMFDAIYASRHAVAVFSDNFLKNDDCCFQFYVALDRAKEMKMDKVIIVLLEELDRQCLTKYWCVMLSRMSTVQWSNDVNDMMRIVFEEKIIQLIRRR